jgi:hypothetical protein
MILRIIIAIILVISINASEVVGLPDGVKLDSLKLLNDKEFHQLNENVIAVFLQRIGYLDATCKYDKNRYTVDPGSIYLIDTVIVDGNAIECNLIASKQNYEAVKRISGKKTLSRKSDPVRHRVVILLNDE